jgi:hypothetical protein
MQNYQPDPISPAFFVVALVLLLFIISWLFPRAFHRQVFYSKQMQLYKILSEREEYFRQLRAGHCRQRAANDEWRIRGMSDLDFELFLTSIWRESEFWYPRRMAEFRLFESEQKFIVHQARKSSPTAEGMDYIEYLV